MYKRLLIVLLFLVILTGSFGIVNAAYNDSVNPYLHDSDSVSAINSDTTVPVRRSSDPGNNTLNVATNKTIKISFSEPIKLGSSWIELKSSAETVSIRKIITGNTLIIDPINLLKKGTCYTIVLHSHSITDLAGNGVECYTSRFTTSIRIDIVNIATGGDITKNSLLYSYIPKTVLSDQIISKAKIGTPMITFGNGNGPKVLIVAGVHGNELPASAAAMKLINYLNGKTIRGTVYIIPFAIPYSTSHCLRNWNQVDPNDLANVAGSPTNIIVNLAKKLQVNAVGDFHSSQPGGVPGRDSALCTQIPTFKSYRIAWYISKKSGSTLIADKIAGEKYPGALEDVCNLKGIPAVTCEVLASHGTLNYDRINKSCNQMISLLKYFLII